MANFGKKQSQRIAARRLRHGTAGLGTIFAYARAMLTVATLEFCAFLATLLTYFRAKVTYLASEFATSGHICRR